MAQLYSQILCFYHIKQFYSIKDIKLNNFSKKNPKTLQIVVKKSLFKKSKNFKMLKIGALNVAQQK